MFKKILYINLVYKSILVIVFLKKHESFKVEIIESNKTDVSFTAIFIIPFVNKDTKDEAYPKVIISILYIYNFIIYKFNYIIKNKWILV